MNLIFNKLVILIPLIFILLLSNTYIVHAEENDTNIKDIENYKIEREDVTHIAESEFITECMNIYKYSSENLQIKVENRGITNISKDDYNLLCRCVQAEAGNQTTDTKVAVTEIILNRLECNERSFAKYQNLSDVIYSPGQFEVVENGSINNTPTENTKIAVMIALKYRMIDPDVYYFNSIGYFSWATPYDKFGAMYLSKF